MSPFTKLKLDISDIVEIDFNLSLIYNEIRSEKKKPLPIVVKNVMTGLKPSKLPGVQKKEIAILIIQDLLLEMSNVFENDKIVILLGEMVSPIIETLYEVGKKHFKSGKCFTCVK